MNKQQKIMIDTVTGEMLYMSQQDIGNYWTAGRIPEDHPIRQVLEIGQKVLKVVMPKRELIASPYLCTELRNSNFYFLKWQLKDAGPLKPERPESVTDLLREYMEEAARYRDAAMAGNTTYDEAAWQAKIDRIDKALKQENK